MSVLLEAELGQITFAGLDSTVIEKVLLEAELGESENVGFDAEFASSISVHGEALHIGVHLSGELEVAIAFEGPPADLPYRNILLFQQTMTVPSFDKGVPYTPE